MVIICSLILVVLLKSFKGFMLDVRAMAYERGMRTLFEGLSFQVSEGELLHIKGENGSGKTSLLKVLAQLSKASRGEVFWNDEALVLN